MLDNNAFIEEWRTLMGQVTPLTEENVVLYVNRREERRRLTGQGKNGCRPNSRTAALPSVTGDLLREIDWCLENGQQGLRSRAALAAAAMTLSGGRAMTSAERAQFRELAARYRTSQNETGSAASLARLERFVAALLSYRISPNTDVATSALDT